MRALLAVLSLAAALVAPASARSGVTVEHVTVDGLDRTYRVFVPPGLPAARPVPVLLGFHGAGGTAAQFERSAGFDALAARDGFVAVYPDGVRRRWNAGGCCTYLDPSPADDVRFVDAILAAVRRRVRIDPRRVYAAGHSNGGMMAYRLACERSGRFAAVGAGGAVLVTDPCRPARPVAIEAVHGLADPLVPYAGGGPFPRSVPATVRFWSERDGCRRTKVRRNGAVLRVFHTGCRAHTAVELATIAGAGHA